ncbi:NitT/TauT family transport system substrate-binding protein [Parabacteroides sp. PF5-5]|uniref:ABC transporter substrate-binding protein n=1 Tax=unclassified Parabacteroides TaxID=2649774 RepID=UPI002474F002|nr:MULTISPECIES: ABC transporter substrate-binding protein [unclassified Parabacteroides]MDH6304695.1 NitT/TauT family transport system substrate-binding protein [Parabacteroides sp. PH5-39]MDH6315691.1 NitT/TauT family transport system substrate-binding protein [Parabacteroides sp. PF5-13]MDH6319351.1 NitT/TauT family transport system substrate-binding protein [Parabacteroides sp. PH5-13]MDH6323082.1 NitT/TauT family transport system substrate-binding protein [Parabacteroides sp. PH5-8]MDH632
MPKYICFYLLAFMLFCGCKGTEQTTEIIHVSVLRGPSAIALAEWMKYPPVLDGKKLSVRIIDSPDLMQAKMIKRKTDIAVLPMINAANLYNKKIRYILAGCPIWGTLYLVERKDKAADDRSLFVFGAGTNPDILTRYYLQQQELDYSLDYSFATVQEVMQALYVGKASRVVLGEPYLSMALRRDSTLQIVADLNLLENTAGFAQTAILLSPALENYRHEIDSLLEKSCRFANEQPEEAIRILTSRQVFFSDALTKESIKRCKINYIPAQDSEESICKFLEVIYSYEPKAIGGKLPDDAFISGPER